MRRAKMGALWLTPIILFLGVTTVTLATDAYELLTTDEALKLVDLAVDRCSGGRSTRAFILCERKLVDELLQARTPANSTLIDRTESRTRAQAPAQTRRARVKPRRGVASHPANQTPQTAVR